MSDDYSADRLLNPAYNIPGIDVWAQPRISPTVDPDAPPWLCVRFNAEWLQYILPVLDTLRWEDYYLGAPAEQAIQAQRGMQLITMFMLADLCGDDVMDFRQNPNNPCLLEYSKNDGATWLPMFDYGLCFAAQPPSLGEITITIDLLNEVQIYIDDLRGDAPGAPGSIAPDVIYDAGPNDAQRDEAICSAMYLFTRGTVAALLEAHRQEKANTDDLIDLVKRVAGGVIAIVAVWAFGPAGMIWAKRFITAVTVILAGLDIAEYLASMDEAVLLDELALREVSCCMVQNLQGETVTETRFQNALTPECAWVNPNAADLASYIAPMIAAADTYLLFLDAFQQAYDGLTAGAVYPCDCDDWTITYSFAGAALDGWEIWEHGVHNGTELQHVDHQGTGCAYRWVRFRATFDQPVNIRSITVHANYARHTANCNPTVRGWQTYLGPETIENLLFRYDIESTTGYEDVATSVDITTDDLRMIFTPASRFSVPDLMGHVGVLSVTLSGTGPAPVIIPSGE